MKTAEEVQRAHDVLKTFLSYADRVGAGTAEAVRCVGAASDVLCWLLGHDKRFEKVLALLEWSIKEVEEAAGGQKNGGPHPQQKEN